MPSYTCLVLVGIFISVFSLGLVRTQEENDIRSLMHDTDVNLLKEEEKSRQGEYYPHEDDDDFEVEFVYDKKDLLSQKSEGKSQVKRLWGTPDTKAYVGRLFSYVIPTDAFEGEVLLYKFPNLPSWLSFSGRRRVIEGVAGTSDAGSHYISVSAEGHDGTKAKDVFAIEVLHKTGHESTSDSHCSPKEELTVMNIAIDGPLAKIEPKNRVQLIRKISGLFMAKIDEISLSSTSKNFDPSSDGSTIYARPDSSKPGSTQIRWTVGCNGEIGKGNRQQVKNVEFAAKNGKLQQMIGFTVLGWHISQVNAITKRVRRQVQEEEQQYSGDDYPENDYIYDYDEDYFNKVVDKPEVEETVQSSLVDPTAAIVYDESSTYVSPVFNNIPLSTPAYIPVKPTRVFAESTVIPTNVYRTDLPSGGSESDLESSLLVHPTTSADFTTPLSGKSTISSEPTRPSGPIEASAVPDLSVTTEYAVKNFQPRVSSRIQKLAWIAGNVYKLRIPKDTFYDIEDGDTRNLTLILKDERGLVFPRDSWIQFDPSTQEVYALPLEKNIGNYDFRLEAMDKDRKSVKDFFSVTVRQHHQARNFHHEFTAVLKLEKKYAYDFAYSLDWQVKAVEKIAALFKDSTDNINVRNITLDPVQVTWTNLTLIDSSSTMCPIEEFEAVANVLLSGRSSTSEPSRSAVKVFKPEFVLKQIKMQILGPCEKHFGHRHHGHKETEVESTGLDASAEENSSPIVRNQIDQLTATVGSLFRFQVPDSTCYDMEDGNSRNLHMQLKTVELVAPPPDSWLQFDTANQEFFGLPLYDDAGRKEYILECMDKGHETVGDALIVEVQRRPMGESANSPVHFALTLDADFDILMSNAYEKAKLIERIGRAFGDTNASNVAVDSLRDGSVVVEWHNSTLPSDPCPEREINRLRHIMTDNNGKLHKKFRKSFLPEFRVTHGEVIPSGSCLVGDTPQHEPEPDVGTPDEEEVSSTDEDYLLTFIVPAVIIAVMLLLAALIACCLYKRRRYGKMNMTDGITYTSKGIPIIFAEELGDNLSDQVKSPVIMKDEKPPLPPPAPSAATASADDAPYHPPPPFFSNGSNRNQRPNMPPAYRKPPTYVSP